MSIIVLRGMWVTTENSFDKNQMELADFSGFIMSKIQNPF
mgnify:CR=1 FL=1